MFSEIISFNNALIFLSQSYLYDIKNNDKVFFLWNDIRFGGFRQRFWKGDIPTIYQNHFV